MLNVLIALIVVASILLIVIVLAQNPKGGGLSQGFGGSNQIMGVQNTNKFLTKATWSLVIFVALLSVITGVMSIKEDGQSSSTSEVASEAVSQQTAPATQAAPQQSQLPQTPAAK